MPGVEFPHEKDFQVLNILNRDGKFHLESFSRQHNPWSGIGFLYSRIRKMKKMGLVDFKTGRNEYIAITEIGIEFLKQAEVVQDDET